MFARRRITQGKRYRAVVSSDRPLSNGTNREMSPRFYSYDEAQAWADDLVARVRGQPGCDGQEILVVIEERR